MKFWIIYTDGDNCDPHISSHRSETEAQNRALNDLHEAGIAIPEACMNNTQNLSEFWVEQTGGRCIIEEHEVHEK